MDLKQLSRRRFAALAALTPALRARERDSATEAAQRLFPLLNLDRPALQRVRARWEAGDAQDALDAYRDVFLEHIAKCEPIALSAHWGTPSSADDQLRGYVTLQRHAGGLSRNNIGSPGHIDWFPATVAEIQREPPGVGADARESSTRDYATHLSSLAHLNVLIAAFAGSRDPKYLDYWVRVWEDFALHHEAGLKKLMAEKREKQFNFIDASQYQGLYISWRLNRCLGGLTVAAATDLSLAKKTVDSTALASILSVMIEDHANRLTGGRFPGTPNQQMEAIKGLLRASVALPDARANAGWREFARVRMVTYTEGGSNLADGSDKEQSFNYNTALVNDGLEIKRILAADRDQPAWLASLDRAIIYRYRFLNVIERPTGVMQEELLPGADQQGYGAQVSRHARPASTFPDPLVDRIRDHLYGEGPAPAFASIALPYGGYYVLRSGWKGDAHHLFLKASRPGAGHCSEDCNSIQVTAYGRTMLVDSGPSNYTEEFCGNYIHSSFAHNTLVVDGESQVRGAESPEVYRRPIEARWHTSANFDFAEGFYRQGYGGRVKNVVHRREVIFVRGAGLWIVTDHVDASGRHRYSQIWKFSPEYGQEQVAADSGKQMIRTSDPKGPNVELHHFAPARLQYRGHYGEKDPAVRGWYKVHFSSVPQPALDLDAEWDGEGAQTLVTLIAPAPGAESAIAEVRSVGSTGFETRTASGWSLSYRTGEPAQTPFPALLARTLLVVRSPDGEQRGMFLDCPAGVQRNGEFVVEGGRARLTSSIDAPAAFRWDERALVPAYQ